MQIKKVVYLFGGPSAEHAVSVMAAESILTSFESEFIVKPIFVTENNTWVAADDYCGKDTAWSVAQTLMNQKGVTFDIVLQNLQEEDPYVVFIGLHGKFGEDGTLQALLESHGLAFTGSDSEASALAIDKPKVFTLLQNEDITVPDFLEVTESHPDSEIHAFADYVGYPVVVMPADSGSSVDVTIVENKETLLPAITQLKEKNIRVMVSKYIAGTEFTCGVLVTGSTTLVPLPPTEIQLINEHAFWDYDSKYVANECREITPAPQSPELIQQIQALALKVHRLVGADGYSRTDMMLGQDNQLYVLEINTLPGMTPQSVVPAEAQAMGLTYGQLLTTLWTNVDRSEKDYLVFESDTKPADTFE